MRAADFRHLLERPLAGDVGLLVGGLARRDVDHVAGLQHIGHGLSGVPPMPFFSRGRAHFTSL